MSVRAPVGHHLWIVAYDISDDKCRREVAKILEGFGRRVQRSVFECELDFKELREARRAVRAVLEAGDRVHWLPQCTRCRLKAVPSSQSDDRADGDPFGALIL